MDNMQPKDCQKKVLALKLQIVIQYLVMETYSLKREIDLSYSLLNNAP